MLSPPGGTAFNVKWGMEGLLVPLLLLIHFRRMHFLICDLTLQRDPLSLLLPALSPAPVTGGEACFLSPILSPIDKHMHTQQTSQAQRVLSLAPLFLINKEEL